MSEIPILWPADKVSVDIVSPLVILKKQANALTDMTKGLIVGRVDSSEENDRLRHKLVVVAPVIDVVYTIVEAKHPKHVPYPATLTWSGFPSILNSEETNTERGFLDLLEKVLTSDRTMSLLNSAIAQTNEQTTDGGEDIDDSALPEPMAEQLG